MKKIKMEKEIKVSDYIADMIPEGCKWEIACESNLNRCYHNIDLVDYVEITEETIVHQTLQEFKKGITGREEHYTFYKIYFKRKMKVGTFGYNEKEPYCYPGRK